MLVLSSKMDVKVDKIGNISEIWEIDVKIDQVLCQRDLYVVDISMEGLGMIVTSLQIVLDQSAEIRHLGELSQEVKKRIDMIP